jgi:PKD repeat protein
MKMNRVLGIAVALTFFVAGMALPTIAAERTPGEFKEQVAQAGGTWCRTQEIFDARNPRDNNKDFQACQTEGPCDDPGTRDSYVPDPGDPMLTIRLKFNVFCEDDGSNCAATQAQVDGQMVQTNADYEPYGITFVYETEFINDSRFRSWADSEEWGMKSTYVDEPEKQCNVYVVYVEGSYSYGTFPWDAAATGTLGGIVMTEPAFGYNEKTLTHELGHNLGLWHTHHGVSEQGFECSQCWESPIGTDNDYVGDFCSDTRPTPTNFNCGDPPDDDPCSLEPWAPTDPQNFMGYGPDYCTVEFTPQQTGRIHCWFGQELTGWVALGFLGTPREGAESVTVDFTYDSPLAGNSFKWYFGDGDSAMVENPSHTYGPGIFDVSLTVETDVGEITAVEQNFVTVWADTLEAPPIEDTPNTAGYWEINCVNAIPVTEFVLPFSLTNVTSVLFFDSVSFVGTRLDYFESAQVVFDSRFSGQLAYRVRADVGGGSPPLPPGDGPIARVHYRTRINADPGDTSFISMDALSSWTRKAVTLTTEYQPVFNGATLHVVSDCQCPNQADIEPDGFITSLDLAACIDILFSGDPDVQEPSCPTPRFDLDCDAFTTSLDLAVVIDHLFAGGAGPCDPCNP